MTCASRSSSRRDRCRSEALNSYSSSAAAHRCFLSSDWSCAGRSSSSSSLLHQPHRRAWRVRGGGTRSTGPRRASMATHIFLLLFLGSRYPARWRSSDNNASFSRFPPRAAWQGRTCSQPEGDQSPSFSPPRPLLRSHIIIIIII